MTNCERYILPQFGVGSRANMLFQGICLFTSCTQTVLEQKDPPNLNCFLPNLHLDNGFNSV